MSDAPEFPRPWRLDAVGAGEVTTSITAEPDERAALARRFGLVAIDALAADYRLHRDATGIIGKGRLAAQVTQACSVTGEPLPVTLDEDFTIRFLPEPDAPDAEEVELDADECDTVFYTGSAIDLGEAAAETLALSLDPFPRGPNAAAALAEAGVIGEDQAGPFGGLAALRDKLKS